MKYIKCYLFPILFFLIVVNASAQNSQFKIESIKAYLFYNSNKDMLGKESAGTLSFNIIDNSDFVLWNVIIGAGSAEGHSNQTLVVVDIKGNSNLNEEGIIKLTCKTSGKIIYSQQNTFSISSSDNKFSNAFLLNDTGCDTVEIIAEIVDSKSNQVKNNLIKNIFFECGE